MNEIDPYEGLRGFATAETPGANSLDKSGLGRDAFLKIFLTQLGNQDPSTPQDASELGAQLAVFSQVEQQTLMAEQLRGVNDRLDKLLEAQSRPTGAGALDPVALIGRKVDLETTKLNAAASAEQAQLLRFEIPESGWKDLLVEGETADGRTLGLASLSIDASQPGLQPGEYALRLVNGRLELLRPDGTTLSGTDFRFEPFVHDEATGQPIVVPPGSPGAPTLASITPGADHELFVATRSRTGEYKALSTHVTGNVTGVHVVDGKQVVTVDGADLDPTKIIRIR